LPHGSACSEGVGDLTHLDPRAPLVVDTRDLPRRPGSMRSVSRTVPAPGEMRGELVGVPGGSDLTLGLRLESVSEGVWLSGTARVMVTGECARCLEPLSSQLEVDLQQLYVYPGHEVESDDDETGRLLDDYIDLEPLVRDAVVLALPLAPVCRPDCRGLCPDCGARLADVEPGHTHDQVDPRWAALRAMSSTQDRTETKKPASRATSDEHNGESDDQES